MEQDDRLQLLKDLLFDDEHKAATSLNKKVEKIHKTLDEPEELAPKVNPIVDKKIEAFVAEMPGKLSPIITEALKKEIKNSQDAVVEALFPIVGKLIKRYIANEIKLLTESINEKLNSAFSFKNFFRKFFGKKDLAEEIIVSTKSPQLKQIFIIEKKSGLLIAEYAKNEEETMDEELIAGMLTAIKSFVEDAFLKSDENLENITYESYTLHIQNFYNYYIAAVIEGVYTSKVKNILEDKIMDFAERVISKKDLTNNELFSKRLKTYFSEQII